MYADLQPDWSPDGARIAFVTDRFSSSIEALAFGNYRLATLDTETGAVSALPSFEEAKNIDPHWSPDGRSVYFVADRHGISNIYRVELAGGDATQMTDVQTGVSGITALSPAISVAANTGAIVYAAYRDGVYEIRALGANDATAKGDGGSAPLTTQPLLSAMTAPVAAPESPERKFPERPYARGLSLVSIGQPYVSAGGGAFGSFVRAGVSFGMGDMLGQQQLETAVQVGKELMDFAVQSVYLNRRSRWTWGAMGGQIPTATGTTRTLTQPATAGGQNIVRESLLLEQIHREASALVMYPFSRARRIELSAGFDAIAFRTEALTYVYDSTGRRVQETRELRPGLPPAAIGLAGVAFVHDTSVHGAASPVLGERYRLGLAGTYGDLRLATLVADYRRYVMPVRPFTIAMRVQHVGRYGRDDADPRLLPFVWYVQDTVRGFDGRQLAAARLQYRDRRVRHDRRRDDQAAAGGEPRAAVPDRGCAAADAELRTHPHRRARVHGRGLVLDGLTWHYDAAVTAAQRRRRRAHQRRRPRVRVRRRAADRAARARMAVVGELPSGVLDFLTTWRRASALRPIIRAC